jgi:2-dehydropantoate 2-reductase
MRIAVLGAGAVGGYYGGMLARAGHELTLIGRAPHVAALRAGGLRLQTAGFDERVPVQASEDAAAARGAELVLCCVKSTGTEAAGRDLAPHLAAQARVWSLQNGVDNAARLQQVLGHEVQAAVVYVAAEMAGPGHVRHHGRGELVIGPAPDSARLAALFGAAGIPVQVSDNVVGALWAKLVLNCAYNALSAITRQPYGRLVDAPGVPRLLRDVMDECLAVAQADGVRVPGDTWEEVLRIARTMPAQFSSTAQDLARGRPSEIDHLNGYVVRRAAALGRAAPLNHALLTLVRLLEAGAPPGP